MIRLEEARGLILGACPPLAPVEVALADALGCVTAADVVSPTDIPPFANTAMDGFAVRAADTGHAPVTLRVVGSLAAGSSPELAGLDGGRLGPGQAVRIMTGAPIPPGADAIVMVERTRVMGGGAAVEIGVEARVGDHVRHAGEDLNAGQLVFEAGTALGPGHVGVLASLGHTHVAVHPRPRVGVLSTGDELVEGGEPMRPGQIRDSNRPTLLALALRAGATTVDLGRVADDEGSIRAAIDEAVSSCDLVLTSGGVSVGDFDYVKAVLAGMGSFHSWQVAIKPAKPLAFAVAAGTPVVGLAGNPVSSVVGFELFARPAIRRLAGYPEPLRPAVPAVADEDLPRQVDGKLHLLRVVATIGSDGRYHVSPSGGQGSHMLWALARANALALLPDGPGVGAGDPVDVLLLD